VSHLCHLSQPSRKPVQQKLSKDFTAALSAFQKVSKLSAEKQKIAVESQKRKVDEAHEAQEEGRLSCVSCAGLMSGTQRTS
jgi:hypothetical protein